MTLLFAVRYIVPLANCGLQGMGNCALWEERAQIIPTPQIALQTKRFCLGNLSCGISIIHFVLYCTWLLMLRYHFVSTFDNELCNLWRQCVPGGLLLDSIIARNETVVKMLNDYYWYIYYVLIQVRVFHLQEYHIFEFEFLYD